MPHKFPQSAKAWSEYLDPQRLAVTATARALLAEQAQDENINPIVLAEGLKREPALCLLLFSEANKRTRASVQSLKHALNLLGTQRIVRLIEDTPDREALKLSDAVWNGYRQSLGSALFAAELSLLLNSHGHALDWIAQLHAQDIAKLMTTETEALYWASLMRSAPLWAMWLQAAPLMEEWQRERHRGAPAAALERRLFGARLRDICAATAELWHLPEMTIESWHPTSGMLRQLPRLVRLTRRGGALDPQAQTPALAAIISHALAGAAAENWLSHETQRLQSVVGGWLGSDPSRGAAIVHQWAAECSREHPIEDCMPPALTLLLSAPTEPPPPRAPAAPAARRPAAATGTPDPALCTRLLQQLTACEFSSLQEIFRLTAEALPAALGVEGATIAMLNRDATQLRVYFVAGTVPPALAGFQHTLARSDIFGRLCERPSGAFIHAGNMAQYSKLLPEPFRAGLGQRNLMLMSAFVRGKATAVICATSAAPVDESAYALLKRIGQQLGASLQAFSERARAR